MIKTFLGLIDYLSQNEIENYTEQKAFNYILPNSVLQKNRIWILIYLKYRLIIELNAYRINIHERIFSMRELVIN